MPSAIAAAVFVLAATITIGSANAQTSHTTSPGKATLHVLGSGAVPLGVVANLSARLEKK